MIAQRRPLEVEVPGGRLVVHELARGSAGGPTVLAAHGITANALMWQTVADEIARRRPDVRVLAPDLRGRADSRDIEGAGGIEVHADDVLAVTEMLDGPPLLLGHSMGAFVVAVTAATAPDRVSGAVLVDGGFAFPAPSDLDIDAALQAVIGPAMERLSLRFDDVEGYVAFWQQHPAIGPLLRGPAGGVVRRYLEHDLMRTSEGGWASTCRIEVVRSDGADVLADPRTHAAVSQAVDDGVSVELVWSARGLMDEPQGLYDESRLAALGVPPAVRITGVDANHYSVVLAEPGVSAVVDAVERLLPTAR